MNHNQHCFTYRGVQDAAECLVEENRLDYNCCVEENKKRKSRQNPRMEQLSNCNCAGWVESWNGEKWMRCDNEWAELRREFGKHLLLIAQALKSIEQINCGDRSPGDEIDYIKNVLK